MSAKTKLVLGLVGAAAAGVVVGLLLAPDSGTATRKKITGTASDWGSHLGDLFSSAKDGVSNLRRKGIRATSDIKESYL
ncbi:MAG TPA: YtxH domain-containing protein [Flavisolibacter sp.]|nr:YtxH domain-containing protein [Flavisolibacter sp.]